MWCRRNETAEWLFNVINLKDLYFEDNILDK